MGHGGMNPPADPERRALGAQTYQLVYGEDMFMMPEGASAFFDLMMEDLFGTVWSRPALPIASRRLLVMGVIASQGRFDALELQFTRQLTLGELDAEQVREVVIQLIPYVGYGSSGALWRAGEAAIAAHTRSGDGEIDNKTEGAKRGD